MKKIILGACLMTCFFFIQSTSAKILRDDHTISGKKEYSWSDVCFYLTKRKSPLIEYHSISTLDCMGDKMEISKFCDEKEAANPYYTRAIVKKNKKVECQSGKRVILKWQCEGKTDKYCQDEEVGCFLFKEKLARRLKIAHQSLSSDKKTLSCYFDNQFNSLNL